MSFDLSEEKDVVFVNARYQCRIGFQGNRKLGDRLNPPRKELVPEFTAAPSLGGDFLLICLSNGGGKVAYLV